VRPRPSGLPGRDPGLPERRWQGSLAAPADSRLLPGNAIPELRQSLETEMTTLQDSLEAHDVMSAGEVAELLHIPESTVNYLARRGTIPSRKLGRRRVYLRSEIEGLLTRSGPQPPVSTAGQRTA
jgi:excisionase family DNA binding protein